MKDYGITHRFNKNLFFYVGLLIIVVAVGFFLFGNKDKKSESLIAENPTTQQAGQSAKENVAVPKDNTAQIQPVRNIDATDHVWGSSSAPVKMIIYDDFECPFCQEFYQTVERVKKDFGDKVQIAFRHFPLENIHMNALKAAEASECAGEQGKFWEMYHKLFADNASGKFSEEQFSSDAKAIGLDSGKYNQCMTDGKYAAQIEKGIVEAKSFNVNGTPTTFINGEIVVGAYPFEDFTGSDGVLTPGIKSLIHKQLEKK